MGDGHFGFQRQCARSNQWDFSGGVSRGLRFGTGTAAENHDGTQVAHGWLRARGVQGASSERASECNECLSVSDPSRKNRAGVRCPYNRSFTSR